MGTAPPLPVLDLDAALALCDGDRHALRRRVEIVLRTHEALPARIAVLVGRTAVDGAPAPPMAALAGAPAPGAAPAGSTVPVSAAGARRAAAVDPAAPAALPAPAPAASPAFDELARTAHSVKGAATLVGARALADAARAFEQAHRGAGPARLAQAAHAFGQALEAALAALRALAATLPAPVSTQPPLAPGALLARLLPLLERGDFAATGLLDELVRVLAAGPHAQAARDLADAFALLDMEGCRRMAAALAPALPDH